MNGFRRVTKPRRRSAAVRCLPTVATKLGSLRTRCAAHHTLLTRLAFSNNRTVGHSLATTL